MSTRTERTAAIDQLEKEFSEATGIYLTDFNGIDVGKITKFRSELRAQNINYIVVKNTLARIALERCGKSEMNEYFKGPIGVAVTKEEATAPARVIKDFKKEFKDLLGVKVAYLDGSLFSSEQIEVLANLPSREVLLAQFLSCLQAPIANFAGALNNIMGKFVGVLDAVKNKKESEQG